MSASLLELGQESSWFPLRFRRSFSGDFRFGLPDEQPCTPEVLPGEAEYQNRSNEPKHWPEYSIAVPCVRCGGGQVLLNRHTGN